jgi:hypothetical protein
MKDKACLLDKNLVVYRGSNDALIISKPCFLFSIQTFSKLSVASRFMLYNGCSNVSILKFYGGASIKYNLCISFRKPIFFNQGLYLKFLTNPCNYVICYKKSN